MLYRNTADPDKQRSRKRTQKTKRLSRELHFEEYFKEATQPQEAAMKLG